MKTLLALALLLSLLPGIPALAEPESEPLPEESELYIMNKQINRMQYQIDNLKDRVNNLERSAPSVVDSQRQLQELQQRVQQQNNNRPSYTPPAEVRTPSQPPPEPRFGGHNSSKHQP